MSGAGRVHVAAGYAHRESVLDALPGLDASRFIGEPFPRNTAPCIGLAALRLMSADPESVMVVSPADHVYTNPDALTRTLEIAVAASRDGDPLVTLGIRPSRPETGYGYIELEESGAGDPEARPLRVRRFVEKPDAAAAREYLAGGRHLWNSGVFIWRTRAILRALEAWPRRSGPACDRSDPRWEATTRSVSSPRRSHRSPRSRSTTR
jgi:mannose-1-phosphate guanylyltransferase